MANRLEYSKKKRVVKACDSCRLKKTKCNGQQPCERCTIDGKICIYTERKKTKDKVYSSEHVELLESRLDLINRSFLKLCEYIKLNNSEYLDDFKNKLHFDDSKDQHISINEAILLIGETPDLDAANSDFITSPVDYNNAHHNINDNNHHRLHHDNNCRETQNHLQNLGVSNSADVTSENCFSPNSDSTPTSPHVHIDTTLSPALNPLDDQLLDDVGNGVPMLGFTTIDLEKSQNYNNSTQLSADLLSPISAPSSITSESSSMLFDLNEPIDELSYMDTFVPRRSSSSITSPSISSTNSISKISHNIHYHNKPLRQTAHCLTKIHTQAQTHAHNNHNLSIPKQTLETLTDDLISNENILYANDDDFVQF